MCSRIHRHSIFCILPPHLLTSVARNGDGAQREAALRTLGHDHTFRTLRATAPLPTPSADRALAAAPVKQRTIYDGGSAETLPGRAVRYEGDGPSADVAVNEAYDGLGATWDFYHDVFGRNSIDDRGLKLDATVHYGKFTLVRRQPRSPSPAAVVLGHSGKRRCAKRACP